MNNKTLSLDMEKDLILEDFIDDKIIINNNIDNILINISYSENNTPIIGKNNDNVYYVYLSYTNNEYNILKNILEDIKNKRINNYNNYSYEINSITLSQNNYDLIKTNIAKYNKKYNICTDCEKN